MAAKDLIHDAVKNALVNDGWTITHDPYTIRYEDVTLYADFSAERPLAATRDGQRIIVEAKSFLDRSPLNDLKNALGQYDIYRDFLALSGVTDKVYLALGENAYARLMERRGIRDLLARRQLPLIVVNITTEEIVSWIN